MALPPRADDPYDLARFVHAQEGVYPAALAEVMKGRKTSHWMWFVFPQCEGLGFSEMARRYAIASIEEAKAYLEHAVLAKRLREITTAANAHVGKTAESIFGSIDAVKLPSSMTLFDAAARGDGPFAECLDIFFGGRRDPRTAAWLERHGP